ncbi:EAL domain-containing protein [Fervidibacillus albus]|uniref:EAL domain-containing protein n=1 Tax=Fervidibacillus albus TaxID=2980026 RepID=A0A9E8LSZ1_9BACI|nr:EAL domain-containing protein [Fervidibacillus albus]WAA09042.1 EAL domain-containing protein [Fervidibacillus albus]
MANIIESMIKNRTYTNYFQPIYELDTNEIIGYESLFRSETVPSPETLFDLAHMTNQVFELDLASIKNSLTIFDDYYLPTNQKKRSLFLNVFPSTLTKKTFVQFLFQLEEKHQNVQEKIVFEINEAENTDDISQLKIVTKQLKERGYKIALDDLGKGYSSFKMYLELEPNLVKIDKYFASGLHKNEKKQKLLNMFTNIGMNDVDVVLEGIENADDLHVAQQIGVRFGQGYHLGKPKPLEKVGIV